MSVKRYIALMLAAFTAIGFVRFGTLRAYAAENELSFTFKELDKVTEWGVTSSVGDDGALDVTFNGQYQSQFYAIPASVSPRSIDRLVFDVTSGNEGDLAYKLHTQADFDSGNKGGTPVSYGSPVVEGTGEEVLYFSIMSLNAGETKAAISGVTFYVKGDAASADGGSDNDEPVKSVYGDEYPDIAGYDSSIPALKSRFVTDFGDNVIAGVSITGNELSDDKLMSLVTKHFNAVTLGNELKPDALFGYKNSFCPGTETAELNGEMIEVPVLDYSRAEKILDYIYDWNRDNPYDKIKVRGHVLVWHSQTPEWFFHEDYDKTKPYVTPEVMNKRLEWYIKTVLTHFTGSDSKYSGMFYGWDVVNEACSDSTGTYRSEKENGGDRLTDDTHGSKSSWWAVYQSNEFIINAFRYANKYAPADVELYYNDYNDSTPSKVKTIVELLKAVKGADGTRIDGMGMQGHYMLTSPSVDQFIDAARKYAEVVDSVQLTEFDVRASARYDGTEATMPEEYEKQAYRYKEIYDAMKQLSDEGIRMGGLTVWGVIDRNSWLQNNSNVGGGANGKQRQCPLFFDDRYRAKPCFWAIVDSSNLPPTIRRVNVFRDETGSFEGVRATTFRAGRTEIAFAPVWDEHTFRMQINVTDRKDDGDKDSVTLYVDKSNSRKDGITPAKVTAKRSEGADMIIGYQVVLEVPIDGTESAIGFDIVINDGDNTYAYNDTTMSCETSSVYYAEAILKKSMSIAKGKAEIDGKPDSVWNDVEDIALGISGGAKASAIAKLLWDEDNLYVYMTVTDPDLNASNGAVHEQDSVEIFIDETNSKSSSYNAATKQYRVNYKNEQSFNGETCTAGNIVSAAALTDSGYIVEAAIKWTEITPADGARIGIELQLNDADSSGARIGTLNWYDTTNSCWEDPSCFGTATLLSNGEPSVGGAGGSSIVSGGSAAGNDGTPTALIICGIVLGGGVCAVAAVLLAKKAKKGKKNSDGE